MKRLYVKTAEDERIGYLDLATLEVVPETEQTADRLKTALSALTGGRRTVSSTGPMLDPAIWTDLAENPPALRLAGLEDASYKAGIAGEQRTAGVLSVLERYGYRTIHSVPLSPRKDIDHLVIGPSGVYAINSKNSSYPVTVKEDGIIHSDGYRQTWLESAERDAAVASDHLSTAARMDIRCTALVVVWSSGGLTTEHRRVVDGQEVADRIRRRTTKYPPAWVEVVHAAARRSDTWTVHH